MSKPVRFDDEAVEEFDAAAEWYEAQGRNLGVDFVVAVRGALDRVVHNPEAWPRAPGVPQQLNVRRMHLRRFPYSIVFLELAAEIRVLAIAHTSREPGFWRDRL